MKINDLTLAELALALRAERKRQRLSREDLASVCGVSTSFIRDAESNPENCTLGKLAKLITGLGLRLEMAGLDGTPSDLRQGMKAGHKVPPQGSLHVAVGLRPTNFSVPDSQLVLDRSNGARAVLPHTLSQPNTGLELASLGSQRDIKNTQKGERS